jgi:hypothetical protein
MKMAFKVFITELRLETTKRPSFLLPWGYLFQLRDWLNNNTCLQGPASKATRQDIVQKHCPSPRPPPGLCPQCGQNGHWKDDCPLCLCKVGQSPTSTLNRVKVSQTSWAWRQRLTQPWDLGPLQDHLRGAQGKHPCSP